MKKYCEKRVKQIEKSQGRKNIKSNKTVILKEREREKIKCQM